MSAATLALALTALLSSQEDPQLIIVPLKADGVKPQQALDGWRVVAAEIARAQPRLRSGLTLNKQLHDVLLGPAREQAEQCGGDLDCLREVGRALGAGEVVVGRVGPQDVTLLAVSVATGLQIGASKSAVSLKKRPVEVRARSAALALIASIRRAKIEAGIIPATDPLADLAAKDPVARLGLSGSSTTSVEAAPPRTAAEPVDDDDPDDADEPEEVVEGPTSTEKAVFPAADALPAPRPPGSAHIARGALAFTTRVTIDGAPAGVGADGDITWTGERGAHVLLAERSDGSRVSFGFVIEPSQTLELALPPPEHPIILAPPVVAPEPPPDERPSVTHTWWFWTAIAGAVLVGGATAMALAGGVKGGPSVPNGKGSGLDR